MKREPPLYTEPGLTTARFIDLDQQREIDRKRSRREFWGWAILIFWVVVVLIGGYLKLRYPPIGDFYERQ